MKFLYLAVLFVAVQATPLMVPSLDIDLYYQEEVGRMRNDTQWNDSFEMMEGRSICDLCDYTWTNLTPFFAEYSKIYYKDGMLDEDFLAKDGPSYENDRFLECRNEINKLYPGAKDIEHMVDIEKMYFQQKFNCTAM